MRFPVSIQVMNQAMDAGFEGLEDALQFFSALHAEVACLIIRDADHVPLDDLPVLAPAAFLASLNPE